MTAYRSAISDPVAENAEIAAMCCPNQEPGVAAAYVEQESKATEEQEPDWEAVITDDSSPQTVRSAAVKGVRVLTDKVRQLFNENVIPASKADDAGTLLAMSPSEKEAHLEFRAAAREARATQEAAQKAAVRYANAVKRLSEVCAPPTVTDGE